MQPVRCPESPESSTKRRDNGVLRTFLSLYLSCTKQLKFISKNGIALFFIAIALINTFLGWCIQGEY